MRNPHESRMAEVYGRGGPTEPTGTRLFWIGYAETKPDATWCAGHVSTTMGEFLFTAWDKERMAWVLTFGVENKTFALSEDQLRECLPVNAGGTNPAPEGAIPGTFPGTLPPAEPSSIWD